MEAQSRERSIYASISDHFSSPVKSHTVVYLCARSIISLVSFQDLFDKRLSTDPVTLSIKHSAIDYSHILLIVAIWPGDRIRRPEHSTVEHGSCDESIDIDIYLWMRVVFQRDEHRLI